MGKRVLYLGSPLSLRITNDQLEIIKQIDGIINIVPASDVAAVIIDNPQIMLSSYAIRFMMAQNIVLLITDYYHLPSGLMLPISGSSIQSERTSLQAEMSKVQKGRLWKQVVKSKLLNQASMLQYAGKNYDKLLRYATKVKTGDKENREGAGAAFYWKELFGKSFKRDRYEDYPNMYLNFGYAVIRSIVAREIVVAGLSPVLGIHHTNKYNAFCLVDDLMEPYRPYIDRLVYSICLKEHKNEELILTKEHKAQLISIAFEVIKTEKGKKQLMNAIADTIHLFVKNVEGIENSISFPHLE